MLKFSSKKLQEKAHLQTLRNANMCWPNKKEGPAHKTEKNLSYEVTDKIKYYLMIINNYKGYRIFLCASY